MDEGPDTDFYAQPRLVTHIDDTTIEGLGRYYAEVIPAGADVLDLMSSWISHLPAEVVYGRVAALGMNAVELRANPRISEWSVHDLNAEPVLPYEDASFDAVLNAVSVQYLVRPVEVFSEVARVLRPGGLSIVAMSHRCFPTKAVRAFHSLSGPGRLDLVADYHARAGDFEAIEKIDRSAALAPGSDPLWIVCARRA